MDGMGNTGIFIVKKILPTSETCLELQTLTYDEAPFHIYDGAYAEISRSKSLNPESI